MACEKAPQSAVCWDFDGVAQQGAPGDADQQQHERFGPPDEIPEANSENERVVRRIGAFDEANELQPRRWAHVDRIGPFAELDERAGLEAAGREAAIEGEHVDE